VQNRPRMLEAASSMASIRHHLGTCCGFLPAHVGVLLFTILALKVGVVSIRATGVNIAQNGESLWGKVGLC